MPMPVPVKTYNLQYDASSCKCGKWEVKPAPLDLLDAEVGDTNALHQALIYQLLHLLPCVLQGNCSLVKFIHALPD